MCVLSVYTHILVFGKCGGHSLQIIVVLLHQIRWPYHHHHSNLVHIIFCFHDNVYSKAEPYKGGNLSKTQHIQVRLKFGLYTYKNDLKAETTNV